MFDIEKKVKEIGLQVVPILRGFVDREYKRAWIMSRLDDRATSLPVEAQAKELAKKYDDLYKVVSVVVE